MEAKYTDKAITIDGISNESQWLGATWYPINKPIIGTLPSKEDFSGRFKLLWDNDYLYLLAEIHDDVLFDQHANPLFKYWDDDCLEVFIDEDNSGGNHQFNFNAFAYHVALDNQAVDIGQPINSNNSNTSNQPNFILLNDHIKSQWRRNPVSNKPYSQGLTWELAIAVHNDSYVHKGSSENKNTDSKVQLSLNKKLGFMLAYCDNDGSAIRESFIGSTEIKAINGDKNLGYITADVFEQLTLVK